MGERATLLGCRKASFRSEEPGSESWRACSGGLPSKMDADTECGSVAALLLALVLLLACRLVHDCERNAADSSDMAVAQAGLRARGNSQPVGREAAVAPLRIQCRAAARQIYLPVSQRHTNRRGVDICG